MAVMRAPIFVLFAACAPSGDPRPTTEIDSEVSALVVDPRMLYREGERARDRGDESTAHRWFERARAAAERAHGKLALSTGRRMVTQTFSPDGRWVVFERSDGGVAVGEEATVQIVDTRTGSSFVIAGEPRLVFARDGRTLVIQDDGIRAIDLETRAVRMVTREATETEAKLAPDGRLVWVESTGFEHRVFLRDLVTGDEVTLRAPATTQDVEALGFGSRGEVMIWTEGHYAGESPGFAHVWRHDQETPVVSIEDLSHHAPIVEDGLLVYAAVAADLSSHLQFIELDLPGAKVQTLPASGLCGRGEVSYHIGRCAPRVYALDANRKRACMWDLQRRRVVHMLPIDGHELSCSTTRLEVFFAGPPDGPEGSESEPLSIGEDGLVTVAQHGKVLVDSEGITSQQLNDSLEHVAAVAPERNGRIWNAESGKLLWQATKPSQIVNVVFAPTGRKIAMVSADGTGWHLDLATGALSGSPAPPVGCTMHQNDNYQPIAIDPHGRLVRYCAVDRENGPAGLEVWIEGERRPLSSTEYYASHAMLVTTPSAGIAAVVDQYRLHAVSLIDGKPRLAKTLLPELGAYMSVGVTATGDRIAVVTQHGLEVFDARGMRHWRQSVTPDPGTQIVFSPDGKLLAVPDRHAGRAILATATGDQLAVVKPLGRALAFDPSSRRVAYWSEAQLVVQHVAPGLKQLHDWKEPPSSLVPAIAWSPDGQLVAAVVADAVAIWRVGWPAPVATIHVAGRGAAAIREDGRLHLLGDPAAARALVACRFGDELYPFALCEDRLVRSDSLATAFAP
jgi:WD40 repeat protein